jgi:hypothetical protein
MIPSRKFDEKMADMRQNYARFSSENQEKFRSCLEKLAPVARDMLECAHFLVSIQQEIDLKDEEGNPTSFMVEFDPRMLLEAVKAWDAGENYTPPAMSTYYG